MTQYPPSLDQSNSMKVINMINIFVLPSCPVNNGTKCGAKLTEDTVGEESCLFIGGMEDAGGCISLANSSQLVQTDRSNHFS